MGPGPREVLRKGRTPRIGGGGVVSGLEQMGRPQERQCRSALWGRHSVLGGRASEHEACRVSLLV